MARIIAVTNQKGGVGKTTTCVNIGASLASAGRKVLVVDLDPQGNATTGCGIDKHKLAASSCEVLLGDVAAAEAIERVDGAMLDVIGANGDLTAAEVGLMNAPLRERRLRLALEPLADDYDYILIDCPPSLNMLTVNALVAANGVLIPMQCEYYALEGLSALLGTVEQIRGSLNTGLQIDGLLRTMFDRRNKLSTEVSAQLSDHFGDRLFETVIPRNVRLAEAPSYGLPVMMYDSSSKGAHAYLQAAKEMMGRIEVGDRPTTGSSGVSDSPSMPSESPNAPPQ
ncbi:MAG TPA: ParA family protein [Chromatiaceae bacterium]|jgi:chromosome partitioning protein|nr:ParA family protein [Chromatiaceae bacterium]HIN82932.1 ParA family protein [Chromatiales bacterium]